MDASSHFRGKRITVMGLGLLGRGVGDARYLAECGAELIVTDLKSREELAESTAQLEAFKNITFVLGKHRLEDFRNRDMILKAAGVPLDSPHIAEAKKNGIPVRMSADLFAEISDVICVGVTGTRGKSTVAHMLFHILTIAYQDGLNRSEGAAGRTGLLRKPLLGGNVRGVSTLALLKEATPEHVAVLELDSWQCQGWGEARMSPHSAVFTTLYPDHLNYYRQARERVAEMNLSDSERALAESSAYEGDLDAYLADKANIFLYQSVKDTLILGKQCAPVIIEKYGERIDSKTLVVDTFALPDTWTLQIPGLHNRYDAALALAAARVLEIPDEVSRRALKSFAGVPGRLEYLRKVKGVKIYNDTTSTTPEATLAALSALDPESRRNILLIMGGADKQLDMSALRAAVHAHAKDVFLLAGSGTERIREDVPDKRVFDSLAEAVEAAMDAAEKGDTVLFSPAFTSFGMFKNEFDRGDQFTAIVQAL